jgi:hypothetical protein
MTMTIQLRRYMSKRDWQHTALRPVRTCLWVAVCYEPCIDLQQRQQQSRQQGESTRTSWVECRSQAQAVEAQG